jgi:high-affinity Fe2+/Pb2+ permease
MITYLLIAAVVAAIAYGLGRQLLKIVAILIAAGVLWVGVEIAHSYQQQAKAAYCTSYANRFEPNNASRNAESYLYCMDL